jgi:chromate transporter
LERSSISTSFTRPDRSPLLEVAALFLKLGLIGFGGPAAHIAMMREEVVARRGWFSEQEFMDLLGATNLIPGPNSTEMSIHIGYRRAGWPGLLIGGLCFMLPAMLMVMGLGWLYVTYGHIPAVAPLLAGLWPVILAIIVHALIGMRGSAISGWLTGGIAAAVLILYLIGVDTLALLAISGGGMLGLRWLKSQRPDALMLLAPVPFDLLTLFLTFLKIGSVLYGGGYVLLAFVQSDFVARLGWLTPQQLLDAVAIGQVTPGPLFTTATFIGYLLGGLPGALIATLGIFLPSFILVALSNPIIPRLRQSALASAFLDGVNAAALGLMAAVTLQLGEAALAPAGRLDWLAVIMAGATLFALLRWKINATWLVLAGALAGLLRLGVV